MAYFEQDRKHRSHNHETGFFLLSGILFLTVLIVGTLGWMFWNNQYTTQTPVVTSHMTTNCSASDLNLSIGPSDGTAGTVYTDAVFTNQSLRTCTLRGYPTITLVGTSNVPLGSTATFNTSFPVTTVTLHPGDSAHAAMGYPEPGNFAPGTCSATSLNLKVTAPNTSSYLETPFVNKSCPGFSVTAIQAGL